MTPRVAFHLALVLSGWCAGANGWTAVAWACIVGLLWCADTVLLGFAPPPLQFRPHRGRVGAQGAPVERRDVRGQWKRVADYGQPPEGAVIRTESGLAYQQPPEPDYEWPQWFLWFVPELPPVDAIAPPPEPPLPEPWQPMTTCPRNDSNGVLTATVWIRHEIEGDPDHSGSRLWTVGSTIGSRWEDETHGRVAWCPIEAPSWFALS